MSPFERFKYCAQCNGCINIHTGTIQATDNMIARAVFDANTGYAEGADNSDYEIMLSILNIFKTPNEYARAMIAHWQD